jgi:DNA-binding NarL/FixJ family response regulator
MNMTERERLERAISALEAQRAALGDAVVEVALAPLLKELTKQRRRSAEEAAEASQPRLTAREVEVLCLVSMGLTNAQVAGKLGLSTSTVSAHLYSIYKKLGVASRTKAMRYAFDHKLI